MTYLIKQEGLYQKRRSSLAYVAGVKRRRIRGDLGARGRKERNACKDTIVFSIFHVQILSMKIVIGQNKLKLMSIFDLRASLCKILISSFAHKMDFAHNFCVDFF